MISAFNQLYITYKTEHFSFKNGRAMQVAKLIKEDWPSVTVRISAQNNFIYYCKAKVLEYKVEELNLYALLCVP